jgi:hypothetical protein
MNWQDFPAIESQPLSPELAQSQHSTKGLQLIHALPIPKIRQTDVPCRHLLETIQLVLEEPARLPLLHQRQFFSLLPIFRLSVGWLFLARLYPFEH